MQYSYNTNGDSRFSRSETFVIFKTSQVIKLRNPAFVELLNSSGLVDATKSLKVVGYLKNEQGVEEEVPFSLTQTEEEGATYQFVDDIDADNAKSSLLGTSSGATLAAKYTNGNVPIVQSIQINAFGDPEDTNHQYLSGESFKVIVTYSAVRMNMFEMAEVEAVPEETGYGPRYSPTLMSNVLNRLSNLENASGAKNSYFGTAMDTEDILEEDLTGVAPENLVHYERHDVNTTAGINLIQPLKGSFYPNDLEVIVYNPTDFVLNDSTRTSALNKLFYYTDTENVLDSSSHVSTQYKVILTESEIERLIGKLGETNTGVFGKRKEGYLVDLSDTKIRRLEYGKDYEVDSIDIPRTARSFATTGVYQNIRFLTARVGQVLITYHAFGGMVASSDIRSLHQDIKNTRSILENTGLVTVNNFGSQPLMIDISRRMRNMEEYHNHFSQVEHRVTTDITGFHWISIAAIYDVDWGTAIKEITDIGQFRIQSALRKWNYEFMVDVDMNRRDADVLHLKTLGTNQYADYNPDDYTVPIFRDNIAARLCWVDNGETSGVVLQIGWDFECYNDSQYPISTDTIIVTNKSGSGSLWTLLHDPDQVNYPKGGTISVFDHIKYEKTSDHVFKADTNYYLFRDMYLFVSTADKYIKEGKAYYCYNDSGIGDTYKLMSAADNVNFLPGHEVSEIGTLYERVLYGHYPVKVNVTVGEIVDDDYYVSTANLYNDNTFSMPNDLYTWTEGQTDSEGNLRCKACSKLIEPEDGVVAWFGNIGIAQFAPTFGTCARCDTENYDTPAATPADTTAAYKSLLMFGWQIQSFLDVGSISGVTLVMFDRRDGKYITVYGKTALSTNKTSCEIAYCLEDMCFCEVSFEKVAMWTTVIEGGLETRVPTTEGEKYTLVAGSETNASRIPDPSSLVYMTFKTYMGTMSRDLDRFDLRQVRLHF